ncbi:hypothetical protein BRE01_38460 [Brevibacillus reuszeri]|uniref:DUF3139 domain-containing protein n=2 Tax=Brevibacillus reuszeri TaxID=54915 RepID=A0ABQ0TQM2_9BACL|nr:DUF3139 domain-containing protein [Brevibacillus reuszeri]MED1860475.1 DUF3139 domain-containing protein [Brevibacillus reuszeri]GED70144.1 hypothetical protein BRE01_38460 [Brevibacillus reuszeri]
MMRGAKRYIWLVVLLALVLTPFVYVQANKMIYADRVMEHLLKKEKILPEQIQSVTGEWSKKLPAFCAIVVFTDEPEVEYVYFAHNEVIQFGYRLTEEGKQQGLQEQNLKHRKTLEEQQE